MQKPFATSFRYRLFSLLLWCPLCTIVACSPSGITLSGTVDVDGQSVQKGKLSLVPKAGVDSPTAMAPIIDGQFTVPPTSLLRAGQFDVRVSITADQGPRPELTFLSPSNRAAMGTALSQALKDAPPPEEIFATDLVVDGSTENVSLKFVR
ncbi:hypothetical protein SAMN06265222_11413 [Neorhodopirellula lusitana]|uniref:Lipoprotein n=1 Tax=Neorhodopirellula lusitana TaxID=445327 RepID=A0ABY1QJ85_9BACT|nr:hypothetical protein [Neorhodopirellula lusitana]SMP71274.1 hypothetical protein SAMN06265222_11413 [Neorhodopirellula lusitana]